MIKKKKYIFNKKHMEDKTYELVTFWIVVVYFIISLIMVILNWRTPLPSILKMNKNQTNNNTIETYIYGLSSILQNNKIIWSLSLLISLIICILLGISIWGDKHNSLLMKTIQSENININDFKQFKYLFELLLLRSYLNKKREQGEATTESEEERNKEKEKNLDDAFLNNYLT